MATYSYDGAGTSDKDSIRFLLGDVDLHDASEWQVSDEEIMYAYDLWFPLYHSHSFVASTVADTIAARYAREASYSADGVSVSLGPAGDQYRALAASLREQHKSLFVGAVPDVGGITPDEQLEPNTKPFAFGKGIHDDVEAGPQEYGGVYPPDQSTTSGAGDPNRLVEP